jgi:hypothetical protein
MALNLKIGQLMTGQVVVDGKLETAGGASSNIGIVNKRLIANNILPQACANETSKQNQSTNLLFGLNMTIDNTTDRNYSLIGTETNAEVIQNPNILDQTMWDEMTNENIVATDKFPNATDNFFTIDGPLDNAEKRQRDRAEKKKETKPTLSIANDIVRYNLKNINTGKLPQFD